MLYDRYEPKQYVEANREKCLYCRRQPESWQYIQNEKVCPHCGTRVLVSYTVSMKPITGNRKS
jgi:DNA-directed RNA polymerase subunit RPC12/RpoP